MTFSLDFRSNLMGTKFTVYDHGVSPAKAQGLVEKAYTRQELAAVCYVSPSSRPPDRPELAGRHPSPHACFPVRSGSLVICQVWCVCCSGRPVPSALSLPCAVVV